MNFCTTGGMRIGLINVHRTLRNGISVPILPIDKYGSVLDDSIYVRASRPRLCENTSSCVGMMLAKAELY